MSVTRTAAPVAARHLSRLSALAVVVCLALTSVAGAAAGASVEPGPWHDREQVLADGTTGPALPLHELPHLRPLPGTDAVAVATTKGLYRVTPADEGGRHAVSTIATVGDVTGAPANWQARLHDDGRVVAFVCESDTRGCRLLVRSTLGAWTAVAGGGPRWLEPSAEPGLGSWGTTDIARTGDYVGADPLSLNFVLPVNVLLDSATDRIYFDQRGLLASLWSFDFRSGVVTRVGQPDYEAVPRVPGIDMNLVGLALLPDGRLMAAPDISQERQRTVDLTTDVTEVSALPVGVSAVAEDGSVWVGVAGSIQRHGMDGTVLETLDTERAGLAHWQAQFAMLPRDGGLLTYGTSYYPTVLDWRLRSVGTRLRLHRTGPVVADPPRTVTAVAADARAVVTWSESYGYGRPVTGYTVTAVPGGRQVTVAGSERSAALTGLTNGTAYRFTVTPVNEVGSGSASAMSDAVTPLRPPPVPAGRLQVGAGLAAGATLTSPNGTYRATMQADGNLVVASGSRVLWSTRTAGSPGARLAFQADGNLVVYSTAGRPRWTSMTADSGAVHLDMQDDGNLVLYAPTRAVWSIGPDRAVPTGSTMRTGQLLAAGQSLRSPNGKHRLTMQTDGNLVLYSPTRATWSSRTGGNPGARLWLQTDGNAVVSASSGRALFSTRTSSPSARMVVQDDGNLVVYHGTTPLWSSRT